MADFNKHCHYGRAWIEIGWRCFFRFLFFRWVGRNVAKSRMSTCDVSVVFSGANSAGVDFSNRVEFSHLPAVDMAKAREVLQPGEDGVLDDTYGVFMGYICIETWPFFHVFFHVLFIRPFGSNECLSLSFSPGALAGRTAASRASPCIGGRVAHWTGMWTAFGTVLQALQSWVHHSHPVKWDIDGYQLSISDGGRYEIPGERC